MSFHKIPRISPKCPGSPSPKFQVFFLKIHAISLPQIPGILPQNPRNSATPKSQGCPQIPGISPGSPVPCGGCSSSSPSPPCLTSCGSCRTAGRRWDDSACPSNSPCPLSCRAVVPNSEGFPCPALQPVQVSDGSTASSVTTPPAWCHQPLRPLGYWPGVARIPCGTSIQGNN
ncbi:hypothetical protein Q9233_016312 [Columba guinea]|nr:hypothetical protein Q9233_016312 [Columba guinea]